MPSVAVGVAPIVYSPIPISSQDGHSHATLIATTATPYKEFSVPPVKNWRDLVQNIGKNTSLAFYNVQTADSCSRKTTLKTKFRLIENQAAHVELFFGLEVSQFIYRYRTEADTRSLDHWHTDVWHRRITECGR